MNIPRAWWFWAFAGVLASAALPWISHGLREIDARRCTLDGAAVDSRIGVEIALVDGQDVLFCALYCAEKWLQVSGRQPRTITVTDEASGEKLLARAAFYARSQVLAHAPTRERRHVFRHLHDAEQHAQSHLGRVLTGEERPFARWLDARSGTD